MIYAEFQLNNLGYIAPIAGIDPLPEIWGLSNEGEEKFEHKGVVGYPTTHSWMIERDSKVLALFDEYPDMGGIEVPETEVLAKLINEYGFSPNTTLGSDGKPAGPAEG